MINVLSAALRVVPTQQITYKKFLGTTGNGLGLSVNNYSEPVVVAGSLQPADADTLYKLGIANTGDIFIVFLQANTLSIAELQSNDIIVDDAGTVYNIFRSDKWSLYPGQNWNRVFVRRAKNYGN